MADSTLVRYNSLTQTFRVTTPKGVPGIYVSKLGLYFKARSNSLGVQAYLVRTTNGLPDIDKIIPNSTVTLNAEDVDVSTDGTSETVFTFPQLIFLDTDESYGFVVQPIASSPDYVLWVGEQGSRDLSNDKPIGSNPLVERAFFSGNPERYADLVNQDLKFKLYRAKFTATNGTAALRNTNIDILSLYNISKISGRLDIRAGDHVYGFSNGYANTAVSGIIDTLDASNKLLFVSGSSGNFQANTDIVFVRTGEEGEAFVVDSGIVGAARIDSVANSGLHKFSYQAIVPKLGISTVPATDLILNLKPTINNGAKYVQDTNKSILNNIEIEFNDSNKYYLGETDEKSAANDLTTGTTPSGLPCSNSSLVIEATLYSESNFVSPVINLNKNNVILIHNLINSNTTNEHSRIGDANAKYISKVITLEDGMEAEDLKVYITANKPAGSNVHLYAKIWNASDSNLFDNKVWSKLAIESVDSARPSNAPGEYVEYMYSFANTASLAGNTFAAFQANNSVPVQYALANSIGGSSGSIIGGYGHDKVIKKFAIKIVLTSDDGKEYLYPKINDLRVIALQV